MLGLNNGRLRPRHGALGLAELINVHSLSSLWDLRTIELMVTGHNMLFWICQVENMDIGSRTN